MKPSFFKNHLFCFINKQMMTLLIGICIFGSCFAESFYVGERGYINGPSYSGTMDAISWYSDKPNNISISGNANGANFVISSYFSGDATIECQYGYYYYSGTKRVNKTGHSYFKISCKKSKTVLDKTEVVIAPGEKIQLTYSTSSGYELPFVHWESKDKSIVSFDGSNKEYDVNPVTLTGENSGETTIILYANTGEENPTCHVVVKEVPATSLVLSPESLRLLKGKKGSFSCKMTPENASSSISWRSDDESIAKVSKGGVITATGEGKTKITATTDNGLSATGLVEVVPEPESVSLPSDIVVWTGYSVIISPELTPSNSITTYKWKSESPSIATVDAKGNLKALQPGIATITVTTSNGKMASCKIKIEDAPEGRDARTLMSREKVLLNLINNAIKSIK